MFGISSVDHSLLDNEFFQRLKTLLTKKKINSENIIRTKYATRYAKTLKVSLVGGSITRTQGRIQGGG